jgi:eukaryotic-like serine/threonine-protein kinase
MTDVSRPVFNDRYEIQSRIGRGGMADVFRAHDRLLDRSVAVKVLFPEFATEANFVERFRREAQSAANLTHPNIVGVFDWGKQDSTYFIVMEYVAGRSLADLLRSDGSIPSVRAADIAGDVAAALGFAHRNNMVHRDIKPANILVSDAGEVKVADFGIARALNGPTEQDLTQAGAVMGTATYFSPEQAQGSQPDPRSDLYSLGIVMYEMVTGRPPFVGDNPVAIAYRQVHEMPVRPAQLNPDIPLGFEQIIHRMLQKDPAKRYQTADELRMDLRRFREGLGMETDHVSAARALPMDAATTAAAARSRAGDGGVAPTSMMSNRAREAYQQPTQAVGRQVPPAASRGPERHHADDHRRRRTWVLVGAVLATLLVLGGVFFALYEFLSTSSSDSVSSVVVENVVNDDFEHALTVLGPDGLGLNVAKTEVPSDTVKIGTVMDQSIKAGTKVDTGTSIELTVSVGKDQVDLPNQVGIIVTDAERNVTNLGFVPNIKNSPSATVVAGTVIDQDPKPGKIEKGSIVTLIVSTGRDQVLVPNVANIDPVSAGAQLTAARLKPVQEAEASDAVPVGQVIRTEPPANTPVDPNTEVKIFVSSGKNPTPVPDVVNQTATEAATVLSAAGFTVRFADIVTADPAAEGRVLSQIPAAASPQPAGATVILNIGKFSATASTEPTVPTTVLGV